MSRRSYGSSKKEINTRNGQENFFDLLNKPIEIYVFIDPLCPECWSLEPFLKKLSIEYGRFFTIRPILTGKLANLNKQKFDRPKKLRETWEKTACRTGMSCDGDVWIENPITFPWIASIAVKAAELQGKKRGREFLRKVQEQLFLNKQDVTTESVLLKLAEETRLDIEEFKEDLYSHTAKKALQCDLKLTKEMEVDQVPTLVFFNEAEEEEGLKITGVYSYDVYVRILKEIMKKEIFPADKPPLEEFLSHFGFVGNKEIAVVYDWTEAETEKEMKKLQLKQLVEKVPVKYGVFWKYSNSVKSS